MLRPAITPSASTARIEPYFRDEVRDRARHSWHLIASRCGIIGAALDGQRATCPGCGGDNFRFLDERAGGSFLCRAAGRADVTGDGFALLRHAFGISYAQAVRMAAEVMRVKELSGLPQHRRAGGAAW